MATKTIRKTGTLSRGATVTPSYNYIGRRAIDQEFFPSVVRGQTLGSEPIPAPDYMTLLQGGSTFSIPYNEEAFGPALGLSAPAPTAPGTGTGSSIPFPETPAGAPDVHWTIGNYGVPGSAPDWWRPFVPTDMSVIEGRPDVQMTLMLNSVIPYLSPEDQVRAANQLYTMWDTELSQYKPDRVQYPNPAPISQEEALRWGNAAAGMPIASDYYSSSQRATDALQALSNMREATVGGNRIQLGPGYKWLQDITGAIQSQHGGRSPAEQLQLAGALDPLISQASSGELSPFAAIGQMLATPFFSRGYLNDRTANPLLMY